MTATPCHPLPLLATHCHSLPFVVPLLATGRPSLQIFQLLPSKRQTLFFTGTWPTPCEVRARMLTRRPPLLHSDVAARGAAARQIVPEPERNADLRRRSRHEAGRQQVRHPKVRAAHPCREAREADEGHHGAACRRQDRRLLQHEGRLREARGRPEAPRPRYVCH